MKIDSVPLPRRAYEITKGRACCERHQKINFDLARETRRAQDLAALRRPYWFSAAKSFNEQPNYIRRGACVERFKGV